MSEYSFRLANLNDKTLIKSFMRENWGEKHPLIDDENLFNYYYVNNNELQFSLCFCEDELLAIAGYIYSCKGDNPDIWVSIWCAKKGHNGAGLELMNTIPTLVHSRIMSCNNIREKTMPFYTFLGYQAMRLPHFYRLANQEKYNVAIIKSKNILPVSSGDELVKIENIQQLSDVFVPNTSLRPFKDLWYLSRRYFDYPYQKYDVWRIKNFKENNALLVTRTTSVNGINVLRIVDFVGEVDLFRNFGFGIDALMQRINAEYADIYCYGISEEIMQSAGFCERLREDENVIPNYLSPPLYENTEYFFFTQDITNFTMFKADGDQDRANIVV